MRKPSWLNKQVDLSQCRQIKQLITKLNLNTVCQEALCPNISQCFKAKVASFMILGDTCTRGCSFCAVKKGLPKQVLADEPQRIVEAVKRMGLTYVVITSPCRDDLSDLGAGQFAKTISQLIKQIPKIKVEVLIPDFNQRKDLLKSVIDSKPLVIAHNLETVPFLYIKARSGGDYQGSLQTLELIKQINPRQITKSGLMLGLGETSQQVIAVLKDLRKVSCDFLTLGQYLAPSRNHLPVKEYIDPEQFNWYQQQALALGFKKVKAESYARSSYLAEEYFYSD